MSSPVRVRIAPSPTGEPHIGTMYTALLNEAFARRNNGTFILRIEDTDQSRSTPDSERKIMEAFTWMGLHWEEGPDKGGPHAPYRQSERKDIYHRFAGQLLESGHAFRCFCSAERLDLMRKTQRMKGEAPKYDGRCLTLPKAEAEARAQTEPHVLRMVVPTEGNCEFTDGVYGDISMPWSNIDMQVLMKSDGMPTYHLANVVDDHVMEISHVIRGEEWMSSTPKHILLYRHFGWTPPQYLHLPLMRQLDRSKLSKRRNPTSMSWFEAQGYLPEALANFLGHYFVRFEEGEDELMTRDEFIQRFDIAQVSKAGAVFDVKKLDWMNARWIRERKTPEQFRADVMKWAARESRADRVLDLAQSRVEKLADLAPLIAFMFVGHIDLKAEAFDGLKATKEQLREILTRSYALIDTLTEFTGESIFNAVAAIAKEIGLKTKDAAPILFVAITGTTRSLPVFQAMEVLGRSVCRERLRAAVKLVSDEEETVAEEAEATDA
ncbi:glutamate--tRNA ligase [Asticcacaulis biprosthecium]|nr:glutamate--tRNA ligase [Asticcacaulis biprosthecium]